MGLFRNIRSSIPPKVMPPLIPIVTQPSGETPWLDFLEAHIGEHEIQGSSANPFIVALFKHTSYDTTSDETAWCAATICTALEVNNYKSPHSAAAMSFATYGTACELKPGAILVFKWSGGDHHVTCLDHVINSSLIACIGGNQSNELRITNYDPKYLIAIRWPVKA